ncbi:hypothetical protein GCM10025771_23170 [Niveibacterium umoris]|uniref:MSHA biogenesis protein MshI n=1 Tax=Niveibacterium umoris TaxID=1193620 RepID=A0A840BH20_9RHOO|nr:agglutinin biogenesis protein MshI [Niveibacterium umoris]MBB4012495.1 MSHA biogenesis protein MshI [Niveibacterium umoris]
MGGIKRRAAGGGAPLNIACGADSIVATRIAAADADRPLVQLAKVDFGPGAPRARCEALEAALGLRRDTIRLLLSAGEYQFFQFEMPQVPAEELKTAVRWQVKDQLRGAIDATTIDLVPALEDAGGVRRPQGYVVAASNELLVDCMQRFRASNSSVSVIDVPELAQRNIADLLEEPGRATAIMSISEGGAMLTASRGGYVYFTRSFEASLDAIRRSDEARRSVFDRLVLELQRSADVLEHQFSHLSVSALWLAPFPHRDELLSLLIDALYLPVKAIELDVLFDFTPVGKPVDELHAAALFLPLGLCLRDRGAR